MKNHSTLFVSQNGQTIPLLHYGSTTHPDGGLRTSVEDLSKFFIAMLNDGVFGGARILDATSAAEMQRFQFTTTNRPTNFPAEDGCSGCSGERNSMDFVVATVATIPASKWRCSPTSRAGLA